MQQGKTHHSVFIEQVKQKTYQLSKNGFSSLVEPLFQLRNQQRHTLTHEASELIEDHWCLYGFISL